MKFLVSHQNYFEIVHFKTKLVRQLYGLILPQEPTSKMCLPPVGLSAKLGMAACLVATVYILVRFLILVTLFLLQKENASI
jgi:hypothetical protein